MSTSNEYEWWHDCRLVSCNTHVMLGTGTPKLCMKSASWAGSRSARAASTSRAVLLRTMRSFSQSGYSGEPSRVRGAAPLDGNHSSSSWSNS